LKKVRLLFLRACAAPVLMAALAAISIPAQGQQHARSLKVILDPAQTEIHWKLNGNLHTTHGTFKLKSGEIVFNPATGIAEGEILVDATTGESGDAARDKRMQEEVLESNRYPAIFFHPTGIKGPFKPDGAMQELSAEGNFNIHGADHPLTLPLRVQVAAGMVTATTHFTVPYVAWGMKNPSKFLFKVSKQVDIEISAKGTVQPAE
jgi:polyisoprenoid-binding protein YceI